MSVACGLQFPTGILMRLLVLVIASCLFEQTAYSQTKPDFSEWLENVRVEAAKRGIKQSVIDSALKDVKPIKRVLNRDRNQSEFKLTLKRYLNRVVTPTNIKRGQNMAQRHKATLEAVSQKYGVPPKVILAIWGIETRFGLVKANVPLIPSVATLAYDRRRSKYFRAQLFAVLQMLDRGYIDQKSLFGSWAGAMGQPQFMPSSYLAYAQDFDGDGKRDIWKSVPDVLASIANYLAKHGWRSDLTWGREVALPASFAESLQPFKRRAARGCRARTSEPRSLPAWQSAGIRRVSGRDLPTRNIPAVLVLPDGKEGRAFLTYKNYASIMSYNCAHLYALTVGVLSDRIGGK